MILLCILMIPFVAGVLTWLLGDRRARAIRWVALSAMGVDLLLVVAAWLAWSGTQTVAGHEWLAELNWAWIPSLGVRFHLAADGLSILLIALTAALGCLCVAASWTEIERKVGFFHLTLLWTLTAVIGVFLAVDLFLFYFFWEMMLIPTYLLILVWGHEDRTRAALKFFIFTQAGGLLLLISILALVFSYYHQTGTMSFDYQELMGAVSAGPFQMLLMLGFFVAFAVKLPAFPLHTWLPDAHTQAPTAGSVMLAGLLLKTGPYGMLRFSGPLFPEASSAFAPVAMILGLIGILYGAYLAFAQTDLKRLIAYTSISHMGYVLLGIYTWNAIGRQGAVITMLCHGLSTGGLFILAGALTERLRTRDLAAMGGFWSQAPRMGAAGMILAMASLGLPGLGNFVGELFILLGAWQRQVAWAVFGSLGMVFAAIYALNMIQRTFHGPRRDEARVHDLGGREIAVFVVTIAALLWIGLYPQPVIDTFAQCSDRLVGIVMQTRSLWSFL